MKVTRLQLGYSVRLTDSEFEVMRKLLGDVLAGEVDEGGMSAAEKKVIRSDRWRSAGTPLTVDDDRRSPRKIVWLP